MRFNKTYLVILLLAVFGCKNKEKDTEIKLTNQNEVSDKQKLIETLTINSDYNINDVRRYGLVTNKKLGTHPKTKNKLIDEIINLANLGVEISFNEGYYITNLDLSKASNTKFSFNNSAFSGAILLNGTADKNIENITLKGTLISYHGFSSRFSKNIEIDSLVLKDDPDKNLAGLNNTGANIYVGSSDFNINYLQVNGTGSKTDAFRYSFAALAIHGKSPEPKDIKINEVYIKSCDRHGAFLSGQDILISNLKIDSFANGNNMFLNPISYTKKGDEKDFTGLWLNEFNFSAVENAIINTSNNANKIVNAVYLDRGHLEKKSEIVKLKIIGKNNTIKKHISTNVITY